ncbi:MAG: acyl-CoA dehydrogenase family protein, partial [Chloroflexi bacterium]|nr:acyl-CoA dehydrogenase family protein [Chloroflexota bacterium]
GSDVVGIQSTAQRQGDVYILNGSKTYITNGTICDYAIVPAYTDKSQRAKGISLFIVDRSIEGFTTRKLHKLGNRTADTAEMVFQNCVVPASNLIGEREGGLPSLFNTLRGGRICYGARSVGVAQAAFTDALAYAKERHAFGQPIGKFQAIAFKLARMATEIDAARVLTYRCAWLYEQGRPCEQESSMLKLFATEMVQRVTWEAMQIAGGISYMMESRFQRYFRDARLFTITEGTSEIQQLVIARQLGL